MNLTNRFFFNLRERQGRDDLAKTWQASLLCERIFMCAKNGAARFSL